MNRHGLSLFLHAFAVCHLAFECIWEGGQLTVVVVVVEMAAHLSCGE